MAKQEYSMTNLILFSSSNQLILGAVTYLTGSDLTVRIDHPFSGYTASRHIPYFAREHFSFKGDYGEQTQIALLKGLYKALADLNDKSDTEGSQIKTASQLIQRLSSGNATFDRTKLRRAFKQGQISQTEYQNLLRQDRSDRESIEQQIFAIKQDCIEQLAPSTIGLISVEQAFDFLVSHSKG